MQRRLFFVLSLCWASIALSAAESIVVIDPGHGGIKSSGSQKERTLSSSNNAQSPGGLLEKNLTLELSLEIAKQVHLMASDHPETKIVCAMTRTTDVNPDFADRARMCATTPIVPAAIVSIHFNASGNHRALGTLAVVQNPKLNPNHEADQAFAAGLIKATHRGVTRFLPESKALPSITDSHLHGGAGSNFFHQLGLKPELKKVPKCFLEVEFMDRKDVEEKLLRHREKAFPVIAREIAAYLYAYCGAAKPASGEPPRRSP